MRWQSNGAIAKPNTTAAAIATTVQDHRRPPPSPTAAHPPFLFHRCRGSRRASGSSICKQGFLKNSTPVQLRAHHTSKHGKVDIAECFPKLAAMEAEIAAAAAAPPPVKKKTTQAKEAESLDDLLSAGLSGKKKGKVCGRRIERARGGAPVRARRGTGSSQCTR